MKKNQILLSAMLLWSIMGAKAQIPLGCITSMAHFTKRKSVLLVLLCAGSLTVAQAQNTKLKLDNRRPISMADYVKGMKETGVMITYQNTGFLNNTFYQNRERENLSDAGSLELAYYVRAWLFRFDLGGFYGSFDVKSSDFQKIYQSKSAEYGGVNLFVNFLPMPYWGKISNVLVPSVGVGYQTASLHASSSENDDLSGSLGVGGLMFKGCLQISVGESFFFHTEYRQGLNITSNKAPYTLAFGIGGRF
jgi:hypothetical protein